MISLIKFKSLNGGKSKRDYYSTKYKDGSSVISLNQIKLYCNQCIQQKEHPHIVDFDWGKKIVKLKKWTLDEIIDPNGHLNDSKMWEKWEDGHGDENSLGPHFGATPKVWLQEAGFEQLASINLKLFFNDFEKKDIEYGTLQDGRKYSLTPFTWIPHSWRDLRKIKNQLEEILNKLDYKNNELIIYRTIRSGINNWDFIDIFSKKE